MKKNRNYIVLLLLLASFASLHAQHCALLDFSYLSGFEEHRYLERAVPELLTTDFAMSKKITLVERNRLLEVFKEHNLSMSGMIDSATAAKAGKLSGATSVIMGAIVATGKTIRIDCRLVDVQTSVILLVEKVTCTSQDEIITSVDLLATKMIKKISNETIVFNSGEVRENKAVTARKALSFETVMNNSYRLQGDTGAHYLQLDIYSKHVEDKQRIPLNLSLVLDRSGSMAGEKLNQVKIAAESVIRSCSDGDVISVVTYESGVQTLIPAMIAEKAKTYLNKIASIGYAGGTNLSGGLFEGFEQVKKFHKKGQVNRILLLSDGLANEGVSDQNRLCELTEQKSGDSISVSTFGVGADYNEQLMSALANTGKGNYYFIRTPEEIPVLISKELKGLMAVAAQNCRITIQTDSGTVVKEVYGFKKIHEGNSTIVMIGDVFADYLQTVLVRLAVPSNSNKETYKVASVTYSYEDATESKQLIRESIDLSLRYSDDKRTVDDHYNSALIAQVQRVQTSAAMKSTLELLHRGNIDDAKGKLNSEKAKLQAATADHPSVELKKQMLTFEKFSYEIEKYQSLGTEKKKLMTKGMHKQEEEIQKLQIELDR